MDEDGNEKGKELFNISRTVLEVKGRTRQRTS